MRNLNSSLIITTYNRPDTLALVLRALDAQTQLPFEVIIADDGSTSDTADFIKQRQPTLPYPIHHVWQPDQGFRAARIRNLAIAHSHGNYLIFLDGDCIPQPDFIAQHHQLAELGWFVAGNRILLSQTFTDHVLRHQLPIWTWSTTQWLLPYLRRDINRLFPLLRFQNHFFRKKYSQRWQGAKTCNLAIWKEDFLKIHGFNEQFQGWGHEDADLVVRLLHQGIQRKEGRFAVPVFHLWHPPADRRYEADNRRRLSKTLHTSSGLQSVT